MNRVIKFRAWDNKDKKMHRPGSDGSYDCDGLYQMQTNSAGRFDSGYVKIVNWYLDYENALDPTPETKVLHDFILLQFTGLKEKNGKEIYEGDIVNVYDSERYCECSEWEDCDSPADMDCKEHGKHKHEKSTDCQLFICTQEVKWGEYTGYFCEEDTGEYCPALGSDEIEMEIIGNIFENPELLK